MMTATERRKLVEAPLNIRVHGHSLAWSGVQMHPTGNPCGGGRHLPARTNGDGSEYDHRMYVHED